MQEQQNAQRSSATEGLATTAPIASSLSSNSGAWKRAHLKAMRGHEYIHETVFYSLNEPHVHARMDAYTRLALDYAY